jgi:hypothetical protein
MLELAVLGNERLIALQREALADRLDADGGARRG